MRHYSVLGTSYHEVNETDNAPDEGLIQMLEARPLPVDGLHYISMKDGTWRLPDGNAELEREWRDSELARADIEFNKVQDGDGVGTLKAWKEYRKALRAYPTFEGFPSRGARPTAPDNYKE